MITFLSNYRYNSISRQGLASYQTNLNTFGVDKTNQPLNGYFDTSDEKYKFKA